MSAPSLVKMQGTQPYAFVNAVGAEDVIQKLLAQDIIYGLLNPDDEILSEIYLYDANGNNTFYGQARYKMDQVNGKGSGPAYAIWMQYAPILSNVSSAKVLVTDDKGQTKDTIDLDVTKGGEILFRSYLSGAPNGLLVVTFKDGNIKTYRLSDPKALVFGYTDDASRNTPFQIDGHHVFRHADANVVHIDFVEIYHRPTVYLEYAKGQNLVVNVQGLLQDTGVTIVERPSALVFVSVDGKISGTQPLNTDSATTITLPGEGKYRIRFEWNKFGQPNTLYYSTPTDGGGGKGF